MKIKNNHIYYNERQTLNVRYDQKMAKYHRLADQSGFHFVLAVFSHTGQIHKSIKRLIAEQVRNKLAFSEGVVKQSRVRSTMRWWGGESLED